MATKKVYDLAVAVGKYTKDGKEKNRYQNIGIVMEKDDGGRFIILEPWFNPAGVAHDDGRGIMVSMFDVNRDSGRSGGQSVYHEDSDPPF
jgi:hypothetical protein